MGPLGGVRHALKQVKSKASLEAEVCCTMLHGPNSGESTVQDLSTSRILLQPTNWFECPRPSQRFLLHYHVWLPHTPCHLSRQWQDARGSSRHCKQEGMQIDDFNPVCPKLQISYCYACSYLQILLNHPIDKSVLFTIQGYHWPLTSPGPATARSRLTNRKR